MFSIQLHISLSCLKNLNQKVRINLRGLAAENFSYESISHSGNKDVQDVAQWRAFAFAVIGFKIP